MYLYHGGNQRFEGHMWIWRSQWWVQHYNSPTSLPSTYYEYGTHMHTTNQTVCMSLRRSPLYSPSVATNQQHYRSNWVKRERMQVPRWTIKEGRAWWWNVFFLLVIIRTATGDKVIWMDCSVRTLIFMLSNSAIKQKKNRNYFLTWFQSVVHSD